MIKPVAMLELEVGNPSEIIFSVRMRETDAKNCYRVEASFDDEIFS